MCADGFLLLPFLLTLLIVAVGIPPLGRTTHSRGAGCRWQGAANGVGWSGLCLADQTASLAFAHSQQGGSSAPRGSHPDDGRRGRIHNGRSLRVGECVGECVVGVHHCAQEPSRAPVTLHVARAQHTHVGSSVITHPRCCSRIWCYGKHTNSIIEKAARQDRRTHRERVCVRPSLTGTHACTNIAVVAGMQLLRQCAQAESTACSLTRRSRGRHSSPGTEGRRRARGCTCGWRSTRAATAATR